MLCSQLLTVVRSVNQLDKAIDRRPIGNEQDRVVNLTLLHLLERTRRWFRRSDGRIALIDLSLENGRSELVLCLMELRTHTLLIRHDAITHNTSLQSGGGQSETRDSARYIRDLRQRTRQLTLANVVVQSYSRGSCTSYVSHQPL